MRGFRCPDTQVTGVERLLFKQSEQRHRRLPYSAIAASPARHMAPEASLALESVHVSSGTAVAWAWACAARGAEKHVD
ncbi:hypothetical protein PAL_GLEAN10019260 [Pteropus alecto]|uniref:Uncharacterized protein n=1 Tax=Pteropus alecto TaxID=9402 RepID=L5JSF0_PTEAL|nr:hypothetical protein PAL_GLEAN10019260 [Pteropus alecto]